MEKIMRLLILEDNPDDAELIQRLLRKSGLSFTAKVAGDKDEFFEALEDDNSFDAVLADNALPQYNSLEALNMIRKKNPDIAFILVTGTVSEEFAVKIIQEGADDYILKSNLTRLPAALTKAVANKRNQHDRLIAEKNIEREKDLSAAIINSLPGIFYFFDPETSLLRCNTNFEKISGYSCDELTISRPEGFFEQDDSDRINGWMDTVIEKGQAEIEANLLTKDLRTIPFYFTGSSILVDGRTCLMVIGLDISTRKLFEKQLKEANEHLRQLTGHMEKIKEEEQTRIAREIHDQLGQLLTGLKMDVSWLGKKVDAGKIDPFAIREKLNEMSSLLDEAVQTVRKVAADLRPSLLDNLGLPAAIEWYSEEVQKRSGLIIEFKSPEAPPSLDPVIANGLFRVYQEAITNIVRHAKATRVSTTLRQSSSGIELGVTDNGQGFDARTPRKTLGLLGMRERVNIMNGMFNIQSQPGRGTTVLITVPLKE